MMTITNNTQKHKEPRTLTFESDWWRTAAMNDPYQQVTVILYDKQEVDKRKCERTTLQDIWSGIWACADLKPELLDTTDNQCVAYLNRDDVDPGAAVLKYLQVIGLVSTGKGSLTDYRRQPIRWYSASLKDAENTIGK